LIVLLRSIIDAPPWLLAAASLALIWPVAARAEELSQEQIELFEKKIRPVLVEHCYQCHSAQAEKLQGKLLLDSRELARKGGESGPAIVPGRPDESLIVAALRYESFEMPPSGKLPPAVIADFEKWIKLGAADPREGSGSPAVAAPAIDFEKGRQFWAFQRPRVQELPAITRDNPSRPAPLPQGERGEVRFWPAARIDSFLLARIESAGLTPAVPAERATWLRRASLDLVGLPPTPDDVAEFAADHAPDAHEKAIDRLLASPRHGERVARMWLDLARYAEDQAHIVGNNSELFYPNAYLYRDWVIAALNRDLPYDEFVKLQLAADVIEGDDSTNVAALGLLGLGPKYYGRGSLAVMADEWEDRVDIVGRGLLGLTLACARCHDHKFDPIGTEDYYALAGVFASTAMFNRPLSEDVEKKPPPDNKEDFAKFENGKGAGGEAKKPGDAMHVVREGSPMDLAVFIRGNVNSKGPAAPRHFPRVLCQGDPAPFASGSGRRELAEAIASPENPLAARVIVNRLWGLYFGQPLVATPSNFGAMGERPTHPELLDDLAVRFIEHGWSLKWLAREIASSAAYRQDSQAGSATLAADPENRLLARMNRRRLSVEQWRDAILSANGRLDHSLGGPSLDPQDPAQRRRTVYSQASRLELNKLLAMFDYPDPNVHADRRVETTTPLQKMFVLNSPFMVAQAGALAERLTGEAVGDDAAAIDRAYWLLYSRPPSDAERKLGLAYLKGNGTRSVPTTERWQQYAHVLLASSELMYLD
jgi:hypothetical protein